MSDEPWAFAVTWDGHRVDDEGSSMVIFPRAGDAEDHADELEDNEPHEAGDLPQVVPLYPRDEAFEASQERIREEIKRRVEGGSL